MFLKNLEEKKLLLASKSPRRKQLLEDAGFTFEIITSKDIKEDIPEHISNEDAAVFLAELKANAYRSELNDNNILIAADTIVCMENKILGKQKDYKDAFKMIKSLSGKKHKVITAPPTHNRSQQSTSPYVYSKKRNIWRGSSRAGNPAG